MRTQLVAGAVAALVVSVAGSAIASSTAETAVNAIRTQGTVLAIAADGARVAIHTRLPGGKRECHRASVWNVLSGGLLRISHRGSCLRNGEIRASVFDGLTLAGGRLAWIDFQYGNHPYCNGPFTATVARRTAGHLGVCHGDDPDRLFDFAGDGALLTVSSYTRCEADCVDGNGNLLPDGDYRVGVSRLSGRKLVRVLSPRDHRKLLSVNAGRKAVREPGGEIMLYTASGRAVQTLRVGAGVRDAMLSGPQLLVRRRDSVELYDVSSGNATGTRGIERSASLRDVEKGVAVYLLRGRIHLLRLSDGRDRVYARVRGLVEAELEPPGLVYAYNRSAGASRGRVVFVPFSALLRRLAR